MQRSYITAGAIAFAGVLWIGSGVLTGNGPEHEKSAAETLAEGHTDDIMSVRVQRLKKQDKEASITLAGQTQAFRNVTMKAETDGRVIRLEVNRGQLVESGDPLIRLALEERGALLERAKALVGQRQKEFEAASELSKKSFTSEVSFASAKAALEAARAELKTIETDIDRTVIRAPFDGVFDMNHVEVGDYVRKGDNVASLLDLDPILVQAELSEMSIASVDLDSTARARLLDGTEVRGPVTYVSRTANPTTRTFTVEMSAPNADQSIAEGLTASVSLPSRVVRAHKIPPSALTLNDSGEVGIKLVQNDSTVRFVPANVVASDTRVVWIEGLPETVSVITVGQELVREGDTVRPVYVDPVQPIIGGNTEIDAESGGASGIPGLSGAAAMGGLE